MPTPTLATSPRPQTTSAAAAEPLRVAKFRAMNTSVTLQVLGSGPATDAALADAEAVFRRVEAACTRFNPRSPLMKANAAAGAWCTVPPECHLALTEALRGYHETAGLFDPRVLETLVGLGYDRTLPFRTEAVKVSRPAATAMAPPSLSPWQPALEPAGKVRLGSRPIDLGGIGKGLAVRLAGEILSRAGRGHVVEAGGDCHLGGTGQRDDGWQVGVEDPRGGSAPVAVLKLRDTGCATSSLRVRSWRVGQERVHHLIDPRTGTSAHGGLLSVTVVGPDTARDEVWTKSLLIAGKEQVATLAAAHRLAALWVDDEGKVALSDAMRPWVSWLPTASAEPRGGATSSRPEGPRPQLAPQLLTALEDRAAMLALLGRLTRLEQTAKRLTFSGVRV